MTLSPFEVERQEFGRSAMGYKRSEVDTFLDEVRGTLVALWQERADLREENERLGERVARFTALEEQLKNTLLLAQDSAEKAQEQARRESELLMREAGQKAREIVHAAHEERQRLEVALRELQGAEQETRSRFSSLAKAVLTHLDDSDADVVQSATSLRAVVHGTDQSPPTQAQRFRRDDAVAERQSERQSERQARSRAQQPGGSSQGQPTQAQPASTQRQGEGGGRVEQSRSEQRPATEAKAPAMAGAAAGSDNG